MEGFVSALTECVDGYREWKQSVSTQVTFEELMKKMEEDCLENVETPHHIYHLPIWLSVEKFRDSPKEYRVISFGDLFPYRSSEEYGEVVAELALALIEQGNTVHALTHGKEPWETSLPFAAGDCEAIWRFAPCLAFTAEEEKEKDGKRKKKRKRK